MVVKQKTVLFFQLTNYIDPADLRIWELFYNALKDDLSVDAHKIEKVKDLKDFGFQYDVEYNHTLFIVPRNAILNCVLNQDASKKGTNIAVLDELYKHKKSGTLNIMSLLTLSLEQYFKLRLPSIEETKPYPFGLNLTDSKNPRLLPMLS